MRIEQIGTNFAIEKVMDRLSVLKSNRSARGEICEMEKIELFMMSNGSNVKLLHVEPVEKRLILSISVRASRVPMHCRF